MGKELHLCFVYSQALRLPVYFCNAKKKKPSETEVVYEIEQEEFYGFSDQS